jgi:hypothetical protein
MTADPSRSMRTRPGRLGELWGLLWRGGLVLGGFALLLPVAAWFDEVWASQHADEVRALAFSLGLVAVIVGALALHWHAQRDEARGWLRWYVILAELRRHELEHPGERAVVAEALRAHNVVHGRPTWEEWKPVAARALPRLEAAAVRDAVEFLTIFRPREDQH